MINEEIHYFPELKDEISKRFDHVTTYKILLDKYCAMIEQFVKESYKINQEIDNISTAVMREDIDLISATFNRLRIESISQFNLRITLPVVGEIQFLNTNILSHALAHDKPKVVEYLIDNNMIDIVNCMNRSPSSFN